MHDFMYKLGSAAARSYLEKNAGIIDHLTDAYNFLAEVHDQHIVKKNPIFGRRGMIYPNPPKKGKISPRKLKAARIWAETKQK